MQTKSFLATAQNRQQNWVIVDATDIVLGRLATKVATVLRGKHKPEYTPHVDTGDYVVVVNADKVKITGNKLNQKKYHRHTGYPGGIKTRVMSDLMEDFPTKAVEFAVKGMMPRTKLGREMFKKLKVYAGQEHPHTAQNPKTMEL